MSDYLLRNDQLLEVFNLTKTATAIHVSEDAIIQMANDSMLNIWDKDRSIIGKPLEEALPELKGQPFIDMFKKVWREGITVSGTDTPAILNVNNEKQTFYFDFEYRAIKGDDGQTICILHTATDVTDRWLKREALENAQLKEAALLREQSLNEQLAAANEELNATNEELQQAQENLSEINLELEQRVMERTQNLANSEARLRSVFEQSTLALCVFNGKDLIIDLANDKMLKIWGKTDEVIGQPYQKVRTRAEFSTYTALLTQVYETGEPYSATEVMASKADASDTGYFSFTFQPMKDDNGLITGVLALVDDVTEKVLNRKATNRVNDQLGLAVSAANVGIWSIVPETKALKYNEKLAEIFGYQGEGNMTYDQAIGQVSEEYQQVIAKEIESAIADGGHYDITYTQRRFNDNELIWLRSSGKLSQDVYGKYTIFSGVVMDITKQVKSALALQNMNEELGASNEELAVINEELAAANEEYSALNEEMQATNEELAIARHELLKLVDQLKNSEANYRQAIESGRMGIWDIDFQTQQFTISERCREIFGFDLNHPVTFEDVLAIVDADFRDLLINTLHHIKEEEEYNDLEFPFTHLISNERKWIKIIGKTHKDADNNPVGFTGMNMDITEQKQDEQRKNDFIGMVSHELKTPLTSLSGYIQLLQVKAKKADDGFASMALDKAGKQVSKMSSMINGFLNISRLESGKILLDKHIFRLDELVESNIEETRLTGSGHTISYPLMEEITVFADQDKIGNVISNILSNAVKYAPNNKNIEVNCTVVDDMAQISVRDEGMGIEKEDLDKLFERYYRVENSHTIAGFGIGLYLSAEIIERHNGKIWVESELGKGSTFYFTLPLHTR